MTPNWPKIFTFLYPFLIVELTKETLCKSMHFICLLYIRIINPLIPSNPLNNGCGSKFFYGSPQLIDIYMHMKFQVNILCSSGIMRGDRQTIQPSNHPTNHPAIQPTSWIVGIRWESKNGDIDLQFGTKWSSFCQRWLTHQIIWNFSSIHATVHLIFFNPLIRLIN